MWYPIFLCINHLFTLSGVIALTCVKLSCFNLGCQPVFVKIIKINFIVFLI
ncbi:hypothetical protein barba129G_phanotate161 [Rheinheimera phage vB_RspM_barba_12-9G]|nr:hypothetical protein barba129G_phanotate161 [Rheinheimera phage vB_RspM_barba_12-9G]